MNPVGKIRTQTELHSFSMGAYHIFGDAQANKFGVLDQAPENGTHPFSIAALHDIGKVAIIKDTLGPTIDQWIPHKDDMIDNMRLMS